jgi:H/ACA ribonucleoprotein complex non-core subunit NAF1
MLTQLSLTSCIPSPLRGCLPPDSGLGPGFDPVEEWLIDFNLTMSAKMEAKSLGPTEEEVVLHALEGTMACDDAKKVSDTLAMLIH